MNQSIAPKKIVDSRSMVKAKKRLLSLLKNEEM
jgi:hypothetical protein